MQAFWERYRYTLIAVLALVAVSVLGLWVRGGSLDQRIFRWVNTCCASPALNAVAVLCYVLGSLAFGFLLAAALFLLGERRMGISLLAVLLVGGALVVVIKAITRQPRPWQELSGVRVLEPFFGDSGYPSGHATEAFLLAYLLSRAFPLPKAVQGGLYTLAALIALSRLYVGQHYPSDVIVGALVGLLLGSIAVHNRLWPGRRR